MIKHLLPESLTIARGLGAQLPPGWRKVIRQIEVAHNLTGDRYTCRVHPHGAEPFTCTVDELNAWVAMTLAMTPQDYEPTDDDYLRLFALRGGCRCQVPNASPPCRACSTPITQSEAEALGLPPGNYT